MRNIVLIACHKECKVSLDTLYLPIQVGADGKEDIGFIRDNTGENISSLNPFFSELTGLYWAWKNLDYDNLGLVHYRRYFTLHRLTSKKDKLSLALCKKEADKLLNGYKVLVPKKRNYYIETIYSHYQHTFDNKQLDIIKEIIDSKYPQYSNSVNKVFKQRSAYMFNMFIMSKELVESYCEFLFPLLFELKERYDDSKLSDFEKRYLGRVSEILFNVWLDKNVDEREIKELNYLYLGKVDWFNKAKSFLQAKFLNKKYEKSF